jgi:hypothetical protein
MDMIVTVVRKLLSLPFLPVALILIAGIVFSMIDAATILMSIVYQKRFCHRCNEIMVIIMFL